MPVKKKSQSRAKRLLSMFNPKNPKGGMLLFALIFALGGAGYFVYNSFAASTITQYYNTSGVGHHVGLRVVDNFDVNSNYAAWQVNAGANSPNGGYMWYGPYGTLPNVTVGKYLTACWRYSGYDPSNQYNDAIFDVYATSTGGQRKVLWSKELTVTSSPSLNNTDVYSGKTSVLCTPKLNLGALLINWVGTKRIEVRVKPISIGYINHHNTYYDYGYLDILRTNYTVY